MKLQYLIVFLVLLLSCNRTDKVPNELYNVEEMAYIMKNIYVLEFKINEMHLPPDSSKKVFNQYQKEFFENQRIDTARYRQSYNFYTRNPQLLEQVYAIIADSLSLQNRIESR